MAAPETPIAPGPCPTDEEIAAFLDGTLTAKERAQVVAHLATCKSCYEIFAGAAEFALEAGETAAPPDPGTVIPFPGGRRPAVSRPRLWWLGAAAAAVVALGIGIPVYRSLSTPPSMEVAGLIAPLRGQHDLGDKLHLSTMRGGPEEKKSLLSSTPSFLIGVAEVDLRLSLWEDDLAHSTELTRRIGKLLDQVDFMQDQRDMYYAEAAKLTSQDALRRFAQDAPAREAALEGKDSFVLPEFMAFGKWTEAGRLAAATQTPGFFEDRKNRRFLSVLLRGRYMSLDPEVKTSLRQVETVWDSGRFAPEDFSEMEKGLDQVIGHYEGLLAADETSLTP